MKDGENMNVFKGRKKADIKEEFVMVFNKTLTNALISKQLTIVDLTVLFKVVEYVSFGNVINLTQQHIADDIGIKRQQVNRSFKKLRETGIFIDGKKGSLFLNPQYLVKGDMYKATESEAYKEIRNQKYNELSQYFSGAELDLKVHEQMNFTKP